MGSGKGGFREVCAPRTSAASRRRLESSGRPPGSFCRFWRQWHHTSCSTWLEPRSKSHTCHSGTPKSDVPGRSPELTPRPALEFEDGEPAWPGPPGVLWAAAAGTPRSYPCVWRLDAGGSSLTTSSAARSSLSAARMHARRARKRAFLARKSPEGDRDLNRPSAAVLGWLDVSRWPSLENDLSRWCIHALAKPRAATATSSAANSSPRPALSPAPAADAPTARPPSTPSCTWE